MKILLLQLPLIDHNYDYIDGNYQQAPGVIKGYIDKYIKEDIYVEIFPYEKSNFLSAKTIAKEIIQKKPDIVGFTSYLWNIEENFKIANKIKKSYNPVIIFGGPEISIGSIAFEKKRDQVDYFVSGEGEWFFEHYFQDNVKKYTTKYNDNNYVVQPPCEIISAQKVIEPYSEKIINPMPDNSIFMELVRGCPYKCVYCYYSKNVNKIRNINISKFKSIVSRQKLNEIYLLAPSLDRSAGFDDLINFLKDNNKNIKLHTEIRTENITKDKAENIYSAGFKSLEVGLQTLNKKTLEKIKRNSNVEKEIEGIKNLLNAKIDLKIGIIPGLPQDSYESFLKTIDTLIDYGFGDYLEYYPLLVLPGTVIRKKFDKKKVIYQRKPPYFLLENDSFTMENIKEIQEYIEDRTGNYVDNVRLPDLIEGKEGNVEIEGDAGEYIKGVSFNGDITKNWNFENFQNFIETNVFTYIITRERPFKNITSLLAKLFPGKTENLYNVIIKHNDIIEEYSLYRFIEEKQKNNFYNRSKVYAEWVITNNIIIYQIFADLQLYNKARTSYTMIQPILEVNIDNYEKFLSAKGIEDYYLYIANSAYESVKNKLYDNYSNDTERLSFQNESDKYDYYKTTGKNCNNYNIKLFIKKY